MPKSKYMVNRDKGWPIGGEIHEFGAILELDDAEASTAVGASYLIPHIANDQAEAVRELAGEEKPKRKK